MDFAEIIGHDKIKSQILREIKLNRFSHAHIIVGEDGIGKSIIALETAKIIVNNKKTGFSTDIIEYKLRENRKSIGIDDIKNIIDETSKKPYEGNKKVIIVYNADLITETAQNAFLKTIEEPFEGVYIILLCEKMDNILDTIQSRCAVYKLSRLKDDEMIEFLNKRFPSLSHEEKKSIIAFSDGIPGRAEKFIQDTSFHEIRNTSLDLLKDLNNGDLDVISKYSSFLFKYRTEWKELFTCILSYIRDVFVYKETANQEMLINRDKFYDIKLIGEMFSFSKLSYIIDIIKRAEKKLEANVNPNLVFNSIILKMQEV
ncbi:DNA polymerase III subunit delta' [Clostridium sp. cel8]|uniref:DNA polymerase III subunit delta' n=1 Tax=Clostridium sp. cel8 TaxID=2663123 RepID=UPI0015F41729|nr:DNA polymerase III subunit delta' [Clostridium sp. cel8]MBA5851400.1 DNA polymerase III subunit delta' [Clostridium sp. cel8]